MADMRVSFEHLGLLKSGALTDIQIECKHCLWSAMSELGQMLCRLY